LNKRKKLLQTRPDATCKIKGVQFIFDKNIDLWRPFIYNPHPKKQDLINSQPREPAKVYKGRFDLENMDIV